MLRTTIRGSWAHHCGGACKRLLLLNLRVRLSGGGGTRLSQGAEER